MLKYWALFAMLQVVSAGHMNYQQEAGYYEINPIYGKHPSKERVYMTKAAEIGCAYLLTEIFPKYKKEILLGASAVTVGFIISDTAKGISLEMRF